MSQYSVVVVILDLVCRRRRRRRRRGCRHGCRRRRRRGCRHGCRRRGRRRRGRRIFQMDHQLIDFPTAAIKKSGTTYF